MVLEDDYDGELRFDVAPLPLLGALGPDVVVHLGTSSKILSPTLGVGWLVAPPAVRARPAGPPDRHRDAAGAGRPAGPRRAGGAPATWPGTCAGCGGRWPAGGSSCGRRSPPRGAWSRATPRARTSSCRWPTSPRRRRWWPPPRRWAWRWTASAAHHLADGPGRRAGLVLGFAAPTRAELDRVLPVLTALLRRG